MATGLLILRLAVGAIFFAHGAQKLFGWFGGYGVEGTGGFLESQGFRPGRAHAVLVGVSEAVGGLLLAMGLFTPFASAAIIGVMLTAMAVAHWAQGFFNTNGGIEFPLALAAAATALAFTGPGQWSLDAAAGFDVNGWRWGSGALVLGLTVASIVLVLRMPMPPDVAASGSEEDASTRAA